MKNVKFRGTPRQKDEFRGEIQRWNSAEKPKFCGSARNSVGRGKLWALIISDAVRIYFTSMTAKDLTLSQVFCSDVLFFFPHHQLCVNQGFHFVGSSFVLCFLEWIKWPKSPLFSLMGSLRLSIYTCQQTVHWVGLQHHLFRFALVRVPLHFLSNGLGLHWPTNFNFIFVTGKFELFLVEFDMLNPVVLLLFFYHVRFFRKLICRILIRKTRIFSLGIHLQCT